MADVAQHGDKHREELLMELREELAQIERTGYGSMHGNLLQRAYDALSASASTGAFAVGYERAPSLDKRIKNGDDFAGDAWVRWVAVGHTPFARTDEEPPSAIVATGLPPMTEDLGDILGRPNFTCRSVAALLRFNGQSIPSKAEDEQAWCIYFLLDLYLKHGATWRAKAKEILGEINERRVKASAGDGTQANG